MKRSKKHLQESQMVDKPTLGSIVFGPKRERNATSNGPELPPMALVRVEHYEQLQAELAALRAELHQTRSDRQREHDLRCRLAGEAEALRARVAELQRDLMYAEDAAQKGRLARENAAGMELRIAELEGKITATIMWLEREQPDVFRRGLWDAIGATESAGNVDLTKE
jgi:hypothetical protein